MNDVTLSSYKGRAGRGLMISDNKSVKKEGQKVYILRDVIYGRP